MAMTEKIKEIDRLLYDIRLAKPYDSCGNDEEKNGAFHAHLLAGDEDVETGNEDDGISVDLIFNDDRKTCTLTMEFPSTHDIDLIIKQGILTKKEMQALLQRDNGKDFIKAAAKSIEQKKIKDGVKALQDAPTKTKKVTATL